MIRFRMLALAALAVLFVAFAASACDDDGTDSGGHADGTPGAGGGASTPDPEAPALTDPALQLETIRGLQSPTQMVFLSPDDLLVAEKASGKIVRVRDGSVEDAPVLQLAANGADERGVLGLTLHPGFALNNFVYVYWTWRGGGDEPDALFGPPSSDIEEVPPLGNRVDRFIWNGAVLTFERNIIQLPSRTTDLTLDRRRGNHNGGVIDFGPDGKLYVVIGDQNDRGPLQNVAAGEQRSGIDSLAGVVLRLNDDGTAPVDNPFVGQVDDLALENIFLYGLRNSYGFDWAPQTGAFWIQVNGQASFDQIGSYLPGDNLGWIQLMGPPERFTDYKALELPTDRQLDSPAFPPAALANSADEALTRLVQIGAAAYRPPAFSWRNAVAPAALQFLAGADIGSAHDGVMLVGDVNTGTLYRFELTPDAQDLLLEGRISDRVNDNADDPVGELANHVFGSGFFVTTDIEVAPDGAVWIASLANNELYRITTGGAQ